MLKNKTTFRLLLKFSLVSALVFSALYYGVNRVSVSAHNASASAPSVSAVTEYNARDEFSLTQGGTTGVWNYGYSTSSVDNTFNLFTQGAPSDTCGSMFDFWSSPGAGGTTPHVGRNPGTSSVPCNGLNYPAELLVFHPGYHLDLGRRAILRWTAPVAGTYLVNGVTQRIDNASTDLKILKNTTEPALFSGEINGASSQLAFNFTVTVAIGDTLDFSIGSGPDGYYGDSTGLALTIGQPVTACQTTPANQRVALLGEDSPSDTQSVNTNASLVGDASYVNAGKVGRAFSFDGAGDYVQVEDSPAQKPLNQLTVEGWFKINSLTGVPHLVSKPLKNSQFNSYALWIDGGNVRVGYYDAGGTFFFYATGFVPQLGVWNHYAMVLNTDDVGPTANTIKLFVNGVQTFSGAAGLPIYYNGINDALAPHPLLVGADLESNEPSFFLNGQADEVSLYDRALTQPEIFNLTKQGGLGTCRQPFSVQLPRGLVSWFQGETNALDSRSHNHGTNNGATFTKGKVGQGFKFNGSGQHMTFGNTLGNVGTGDFAVEFWLQTSNNRVEEILSKRVCGFNNGIAFFHLRKFSDGRLLAELGNGFAPAIAEFSTRTVTDGNFHHIAVQRSGDTFALYIDGTLEISQTGAAGININNGAPFVIGALGCIGIDSTQSFTGTIDEVAFYANALTATEISAINAAGQSGKSKPVSSKSAANQIAWFTADGEIDNFVGATAAALQGNTNYAVGKVGQAFNFDGDGDYVEIPDSAEHRSISGALTAEAWFKLNNRQDFQHIISKPIANNSSNSYALWYQGGRLHAGNGNTGAFVQLNNAFDVSPGVWYHVAFTVSGTNSAFYVNGILVDSSASAPALFFDAPGSARPLLLGAENEGNNTPTGFINGSIDEVSIYDRALSPSEVAATYYAGVAGKTKSVATPVSAQPVTAQLSDATVTFAQVTTAGTTSEAGLDLALLPALPPSLTYTGLGYEISTSASVGGNANVCFNLPSFNNQLTFSQLRVLHLEAITWVDRSSAHNFQARTLCGQVSSLSPFVIAQDTLALPTAAGADLSGTVTTSDGLALAGVTVQLSGPKSALTITDSSGSYHFNDLDTAQFYTVTPARMNYSFSPGSRSFSLLANKTDAVFTAIPITVLVGNAIDTAEYFVRQQYLDFLGREPDRDGWLFWSAQINSCGQDQRCVRQKRLDVSASFFMSDEFQQSGSYVYRLYRAALSRQLTYGEFILDRGLVVGGADLLTRRIQFADAFVQWPEFQQRYLSATTAEAFVASLLESMMVDSQADLSSQRVALIASYNSGGDLNHSRSAVLQAVAESIEFKTAVYNSSFVLMEYFGYLRRDSDQGGFDFWVNVLNNREQGNYRGMVCAFLTSTEYQQRFGSVVSRSNRDCGQ